jgi:integrase
MSRQKYQRPEVYATGKREKLWKGEWREYYVDSDGNECSRHKSRTWGRSNFTKAEAQAELDKLLREQHQGGPKRDGSMALAAFWEEIYYPIRSQRWGVNTRSQIKYVWKRYIEPTFGSTSLNQIPKAAIELTLLKMADAGKSQSLVEAVAVRLHSIFEDALDNDFIQKNPARKLTLPRCKPAAETRSLTEGEIQRIWDKTHGREYMLWRILLLTGARISEALALDRSDILADGLRIDASALNGKASSTKNRKTRVVPLPESLRAELDEWLGTHQFQLIFPTHRGKMHRHADKWMAEIVERARAVAQIPDLTFRMCRTTFATLFEGDIRDAQAILGHHSAAFTLQVYRKPIATRQQTAVEDLDRRLKVVPIKKTGAA